MRIGRATMKRMRAGMTDNSWQVQYEAAQASRTANVVCMKWGTRYGPDWVNRLYGMVARSTTWNFRFVCFTDDASGIRSEVECQPLPEVRFDAGRIGKYWPKLGLMQEGLGGLAGMTLFLDLDLVLIDSLDAFFELPGRFLIIREWKDPHLGYGNSSVVRFFAGAEKAVLERFYATPEQEIVGEIQFEGAELPDQGRRRGDVLAGKLVRAFFARLPATQPVGAVLLYAAEAARRQDPGVFRLDHAGVGNARRARGEEARRTRLRVPPHTTPISPGAVDRRLLAAVGRISALQLAIR